MNRTLADRIEEFQRDLGMMEAAYEKARQRVAGQDQEWEEKKSRLIRQISELLARYKIGDEPHKAVAICAQASMLANELRMPDHWVAQYTEKKQMLTMAQKDLDRIEAATEAAKRAAEG